MMTKDITLELPVKTKEPKKDKGRAYRKLQKAIELMIDILTEVIQDPEKRTASDFKNLIELAKANDLVLPKPDREGDPGDIDEIVPLPFPLRET